MEILYDLKNWLRNPGQGNQLNSVAWTFAWLWIIVVGSAIVLNAPNIALWALG